MTEHISGEEISAYLDAEETQAQRAQIEGHLRNCPDCAAESARIGAVKKVVGRSAETHTAPHGLILRALAGVDQEVAAPRPQRTWRRAMVPAFAVLFIAAVIFVGNVYLTPEGWRISCADCVDLLPDYIAHALPSEETHLVSAHLDVCPGCHKVYERMLEESRMALSGLAPMQSPADLPRSTRRLRPGPRTVWVQEEPLSP